MNFEKVTVGDVTFYNVHSSDQCAGRACIIHAPLKTSMDSWPLHYRQDRNIFERICKHGVGHPDPSQFAYWEETDQMYQSTHGCHIDEKTGLGCCAFTSSTKSDTLASDNDH